MENKWNQTLLSFSNDIEKKKTQFFNFHLSFAVLDKQICVFVFL